MHLGAGHPVFYLRTVNSRQPVRGLAPGQALALTGCGLAAMAVFVAPVVLGPLAVLCGAGAWLRGERRGRWVIVAGVVGMLLGLGLGLLPDTFVSN